MEAGDLDGARAVLPSLCGRDPAGLDAQGLSRAAVESVAENTADAVVGALVWGAVAGPAGVAAYRAANTLDAMVGHRSERYASFGWAAARLDDVLSWPGARLGALLAALLAPLVGGSPRRRCASHGVTAPRIPARTRGGSRRRSPERSGLRLGGPLTYDGRIEVRPGLGDGRRARGRRCRTGDRG